MCQYDRKPLQRSNWRGSWCCRYQLRRLVRGHHTGCTSHEETLEEQAQGRGEVHRESQHNHEFRSPGLLGEGEKILLALPRRKYLCYMKEKADPLPGPGSFFFGEGGSSHAHHRFGERQSCGRFADNRIGHQIPRNRGEVSHTIPICFGLTGDLRTMIYVVLAICFRRSALVPSQVSQIC